MPYHEHFDVDRDARWGCGTADCLIPDAAPMMRDAVAPRLARLDAANALAFAVEELLTHPDITAGLAAEILGGPLADYRAVCARAGR